MGKRQRRRRRDQTLTFQQRFDRGQRVTDEDGATERLRRLVEQRAVLEREIDAETDRLEGWGFR
jgi:hypothetical protein